MASTTNLPLLQSMIAQGREYHFPKGQVVEAFSDSTLLHYITSGYVKRYLITKEGNQSIQVLYGPDDIFPLTPVYKAVFNSDIYRGPETYYYEAVTDITVYSIMITDIVSALREQPELYRELYFASGTRLNSYIHRLEDRSLHASKLRVAHLLSFLADQFGKEHPKGIEILVPLTHQDIGEILDLSRETVSRAIVKLREKGLVDGAQHIIIPNLAALRALLV